MERLQDQIDVGAGESDNERAQPLERLRRALTSTDGSAAADAVPMTVDRTATFAPAILALRWITTVTAIGLILVDQTADRTVLYVGGGLLITYTIIRTARPVRYTGTMASLAAVIFEVAAHALLVLATGGWGSPFTVSLADAIVVAGFARGFGFALRIALAASLAVSIPYILDRPDLTTLRISSQWTVVLVLVGVVAGYARRISGEVDRQRTLALDRLGRLADANALLFSLHRVTQTLPASLDLGDVLDTTISRLRGLFDLEYAAVLLRNDADGSWELAAKEGARIPSRRTDQELPPALRRAMTDKTVVCVPSLLDRNEQGLAAKASSGIYAVLEARGSVIGLMAVEHGQPGRYRTRELDLMKGFVETVALAIDNARWFSRLRTVGADEERTRIARDLHDRIGQSLAYLAFELDRIIGQQEQGNDLGDALDQLRDDVRGVIREVRDTLYDLRTDVSDNQDLPTVIEQFASRVRERSDLEIELHLDRGGRLPLLQEREMWRIAQESITNVERHAKASRVRVLWRCNGHSAVLDITDNGVGFPIGKAGRLDSYGMMGMRERASSIGATLDVVSEPGQGTRIRCTLVRPEDGSDDLL
ncbi:MAG: GAF domain-containing sensor histidine kinase [Acidimicrobiia bacterium]|nr:GAF domain-containing sensor histidine kinase [Acidimicrobiia bacterium]